MSEVSDLVLKLLPKSRVKGTYAEWADTWKDFADTAIQLDADKSVIELLIGSSALPVLDQGGANSLATSIWT